MKKAIILHGKPGKEGYYDPTRYSQSNEHWLPWLQHELILKDILAQTPELPKPYEPAYEDWKEIFEQLKPDGDTICVGHSCGAGFLVRWLSENKNAKLGKVILVGPWLGKGWNDDKFFNFKIDGDMVSRTNGITVLVAVDDEDSVQDAVNKISQNIKNVRVIKLPNGGHFTFRDMGKREFPELLKEALS
jgi:predicted alpha/beta hydrolase family esterase